MDVLAHPDPALSQIAAEIDPGSDSSLQELVARMARLMYDAPGIGLAATQIGVMKRVIVFDLSEDASGLTALCNPRIVESSEETELDEEGCLSLPGITIPIERAISITCEASLLDGTGCTIRAEGMYARMLQHEIDHLDGKIILDRATPEERRSALRRYHELQESAL